MKKPSLFDFTSITQYLHAHYVYQKSIKRQFSYESFARYLKYPHRSNLYSMVTGKRAVSLQLQKCIEKSLLKSAKEREYFRHLCEETVNAEKLQNLRQQQEVVIQKDEANILEDFYLLILLGFPDIPRDLQSLSEGLGQPKEKLLRSLQKLCAQGIVEELKDSKPVQWIAKTDYTIFADDPHNQKLAQFHKQSFLMAMQAQSLKASTRHFESLVVPLDEQEYGQFVGELKDFMDRQFYKYNSKKLGAKKLYHMQVGTFPALK